MTHVRIRLRLVDLALLRDQAVNGGLPRVILALVLVTALSPALAAELPVSARAPARAKPGVCEREATALVGRRPATIGGKIRAPKKIRDVRPKYPELPPATTLGGVWVGEFLVDASGKVARVWTIRPLQITPPFPPFNKSIVDAIQRWEYEPLRVNDEPRPFCATMTININLQ